MAQNELHIFIAILPNIAAVCFCGHVNFIAGCTSRVITQVTVWSRILKDWRGLSAQKE